MRAGLGGFIGMLSALMGIGGGTFGVRLCRGEAEVAAAFADLIGARLGRAGAGRATRR